MDDGEHGAAWPARLYLWAADRLYHEFAWAYDAVSWLVSLGRWSHWRRQALAQVEGRRILEIGFGTGDLLAEMAGHGRLVVGLEPSPAMQRVAACKLRRRGLAVARLRGVAQALPFTAGAFDTVVATFPAPYILAAETWQEAARVLRPGGRLVIAGLFVEADAPLPPWLGPKGEAERVERRLRELAARAGFSLTVHREEGARWRSPVFVMEKPGNPPAPVEDER